MNSANETVAQGAGPSVEQLAKETAEMKALWQRTVAVTKTRNLIRTCVSLGVLAIIIIYGLMFYSLVKNFDDKKTMDLIQKKSEKWLPYFSGILNEELNRVGNAYLKELDTQAPKISAEISDKLILEADKLNKSVTSIPEAALKEQTNSILATQQKVIAQYYPELGPKGIEGVISNIREGVGNVAWLTLSTKLEPQTKTLNEIKEILKSMQAAPKSKTLMSTPPDVDELLYTTFELLKYQLAKETIQPAKAAKAPATKAK
jgi:hypothetical protein